MHTIRFRRGIAFIAAPSRSVAAARAASDGVHAFLRGDYEAAVRIPKPLAEQDPEPDPIARFVLAPLDDFGRGTARNPLRAGNAGAITTTASRGRTTAVTAPR